MALWLFLLILCVRISPIATDHLGEPLCRDDKGEVVDWWIIYKRSGGEEYVFHSSKAAREGKEYAHGLDSKRLLSNGKTCPFLRTVLDSAPIHDEVVVKSSFENISASTDRPAKIKLDERVRSKDTDSRLVFAWNDQQPPALKSFKPVSVDEKESGESDDRNDDGDDDDEDYIMPRQKGNKASVKRRKQHQELLDKLPDIEEKGGHEKNMYGHGNTEKFAHSKGILGLNFNLDSEEKNFGHINMYLINHSFPRVPNGDWDPTNGLPVKRRYTSSDPKQFFGKSITGTQSKAQHAMCISMRQRVRVVNGEIVYDRKVVDRQRDHLFNLLEGLDVIGVNLTLSNYVPWLPKFKVYHQLFDIRSEWNSDVLVVEEEKIKNFNLARKPDSGSGQILPASPHAFPIWPSAFMVELGPNGQPSYTQYTRPSSLRSSGQVYNHQCRVWTPQGEKDDKCFFSASFATTSFQFPIQLTVLFKNALVKADTDNLIAPFMMPTLDWEFSKVASLTGKKKYVAMMLITQSWFDHATLGSRFLTLVDTPRLQTKVWCHNNLGVELPRQGNKEGFLQASVGYDHSKWFVSYLYKQGGAYQPIAGFMDLNRNAKATRLPGRGHGRGGMILFSSDIPFVKFFLSLNPVMEDNSGFTEIPPEYFLKKDSRDETLLTVAVVENFDLSGLGMTLGMERRPLYKSWESVGKPSLISFKTPYWGIPPAADDPKDELATYELLPRPANLSPTALLLAQSNHRITGTPGSGKLKTPKHMRGNRLPISRGTVTIESRQDTILELGEDPAGGKEDLDDSKKDLEGSKESLKSSKKNLKSSRKDHKRSKKDQKGSKKDQEGSKVAHNPSGKPHKPSKHAKPDKSGRSKKSGSSH